MAQNHEVDTLSWLDRLSIGTNAVDWVLQVPNVNAEFDLKNTNWSRWAVGITLRDNWQTSHTFKPGIVYNLAEARIYVRNYWRSRQIDDTDFPRHKKIWDKAVSRRRTVVKHPTWVWYRGAYLSYSSFSFKFGSTGRQGNALTAGFTYGFLQPMITFGNGSSLDLDMGVSAGFAMVKSDKYRHDRESNCYPVTEQGSWKFLPYPVLTEAHVGFVYRIGKYPISKKYRWRYDVDMVYRDSVISKKLRLENERNLRIFTDSMTQVIYKEYWQTYDSIAKINASARAKERLRRAGEAEVKAAEKRKLSKEAKDSIKLAKKQAKAAAKEEKKNQKVAETTLDAKLTEAEPTEETKAEATKTEETKTEESKAEATKPEETKAEATEQKSEATTTDGGDNNEGKEAQQ